MTIHKSLTRFLVPALSIALITTPLAAQKSRDPQPAAKEAARPQREAATFENLLAADDYKVFGEIKNVGQLIRSPNVAEVLEPVMKLASPPKEFRSLVKFANAHAEVLQSSRIFFAAWPARPKIPQTLIAIEFSSPEEAGKFEPQLREFLPTIFPSPTPSPTPVDEKQPELPRAANVQVDPLVRPSEVSKRTDAKGAEDSKPAPLPFAIKLMGNLVLISDATFNSKNLRPENSEPLFDNPNFRQAHDRFGSEQIFIFFNVALNDRQRTTAEAEQSQLEKAQIMTIEAPPPPAKDEAPVAPTRTEDTTKPDEEQAELEARSIATAADPVQPDSQGVLVAGDPQAGPQPDREMDIGLNMIFGSLFGGTPKWPDAVGVAISLDSDTYAARVLLIGGPDGKASPVPMISQWVSGPSLTLESPGILPADTELFVAASLDTPQIYDGLVKSINEQAAHYQRTSGEPRNDSQPAAPFAWLETKLGLKVKEDLLPVLGHEIAVSVPVNAFTGSRSASGTAAGGDEKDQTKDKKTPPSPVILISLKDKEAAHILVPKIIENIGFKGAGMLAQKETRDDTEIVSYAGAFAYAFVGNFLVLSADAATTRHVVDAYLAHQTLGADSQFRNATRWQPRQLLGQVYVSPALMESYRSFANNPTSLVSDKVREFVTRLSPLAEPVTYSLSSDGLGPLHELRIPRNLVLILVASISEESNQSPLIRNEQMTRAALMMLANSEKTYRQGPGKGQYASLEQLADKQMVSKEMFREYGYRFEISVSGEKFTATAVPNEYNKTGRLSYFLDETGTLRAADHGGAPATVADTPVQ